MKGYKVLLGVHAVLAVVTTAFLYATITKFNEALTIINGLGLS